MSVRSFHDLKDDVSRAMHFSDAESLERTAAELTLIGDTEAMALREEALGIAASFRRSLSVAIEHLTRALTLYEDLGDRSGAAAALTALGNIRNSTGNYAEALEDHARALDMLEGVDDPNGRANVLCNKGNVHQRTGDHTLALEEYHKALELYHGLNKQTAIAVVLGNIGIIHSQTGDIPRALEHYHRALSLHESLGDDVGAMRVIGNIGVVYNDAGEYPKALEHLVRTLAHYDATGSKDRAANTSSNIGNVYARIGDHTNAMEYYQRALSIKQELDDRSGIAVINGNIAAVYEALGKHEEALECHLRALALHQELGERRDAALVASNAVQSLISAGQFAEAERMLSKVDTMEVTEPTVMVVRESARARIHEHHGRIDDAIAVLRSALSYAREHRVPAFEAAIHEQLRDISQRQNDLAGYIEHNTEYVRITEQINGRDTATKLAMQEAERRIAHERQEHERHLAVLYSTLPKHIADRVARGETVNDHHENASVIFLDIVGFTELSSSRSSQEVIELLNSVFTTCDTICATHSVTKIKTIGDSYMAAAIANTEHQTPKTDQTAAGLTVADQTAINAARAAIAMVSALSEQHPEIRVRVGIHCGPVTAGVIGTERLQYDVWGDTVNVASRMESHGEPGRIHVSEAFAAALDPGLRRGDEKAAGNDADSRTAHRPPLTDNDSLTPDSLTLFKRGEVDVKGKGPMTTYWLERA